MNTKWMPPKRKGPIKMEFDNAGAFIVVNLLFSAVICAVVYIVFTIVVKLLECLV